MNFPGTPFESKDTKTKKKDTLTNKSCEASESSENSERAESFEMTTNWFKNNKELRYTNVLFTSLLKIQFTLHKFAITSNVTSVQHPRDVLFFFVNSPTSDDPQIGKPIRKLSDYGTNCLFNIIEYGNQNSIFSQTTVEDTEENLHNEKCSIEDHKKQENEYQINKLEESVTQKSSNSKNGYDTNITNTVKIEKPKNDKLCDNSRLSNISQNVSEKPLNKSDDKRTAFNNYNKSNMINASDVSQIYLKLLILNVFISSKCQMLNNTCTSYYFDFINNLFNEEEIFWCMNSPYFTKFKKKLFEIASKRQMFNGRCTSSDFDFFVKLCKADIIFLYMNSSYFTKFKKKLFEIASKRQMFNGGCTSSNFDFFVKLCKADIIPLCMNSPYINGNTATQIKNLSENASEFQMLNGGCSSSNFDFFVNLCKADIIFLYMNSLYINGNTATQIKNLSEKASEFQMLNGGCTSSNFHFFVNLCKADIILEINLRKLIGTCLFEEFEKLNKQVLDNSDLDKNFDVLLKELSKITCTNDSFIDIFEYFNEGQVLDQGKRLDSKLSAILSQNNNKKYSPETAANTNAIKNDLLIILVVLDFLYNDYQQIITNKQKNEKENEAAHSRLAPCKNIVLNEDLYFSTRESRIF